MPSKCHALANQFPAMAGDITNFLSANINPKCACTNACECIVSETDFLVWSKALGLVIVEVKAVANKKAANLKIAEAKRQLRKFKDFATILFSDMYPHTGRVEINSLVWLVTLNYTCYALL